MSAYLPSRAFGARLVRWAGNLIALRSGQRGRLCILNYHRILPASDPLLDAEPDADTFRWQMKVLADCFHVMPLSEALAALAAGSLPARAVCITFDDGYRSTHDLALPILQEFGLTATVFVTTSFVGDGVMWNDTILEAVRQLPDGQLDLRATGLGAQTIVSLEDRRRAIGSLTELAKYMPPQERMALALELETLADTAALRGLMLTSENVRSLAQQGIEIGAHTITHPILTSLEDNSANQEISACKSQLELITGKPVRFFAYPNGKSGLDFDARHVGMARRAGYEAAFTTAPGPATTANDLFQLPRSRPWDRTPRLFTLRLLRWLAK
ncbi:MAG: polysaccharide deacetylase family protein [Pseudomonadota bacterium]